MDKPTPALSLTVPSAPPGPSGIARLRNSIEDETFWADHMAVDDFVFPPPLGSPPVSAVSPAASTSTADQEATSGHAVAVAIPIKAKREQAPRFLPNFPPASAPIPPPHREDAGEFAYVQRRVRKTSIDERRVGLRLAPCSCMLLHVLRCAFLVCWGLADATSVGDSLANDEPTFPRRCRL
jgi:GATA-binding protein